MFAEERLEQILDLLRENGKVLVKDLSIKFNVSEPMIRKDLQRLEKEGKIKRTYGGAILERNLAHNTSISSRMIKNLDLKKKIAQKAFEFIEENDMIFLDISSINFLLAEMIAKSNKRLTILTNMVEITTHFKNNLNTDIICIGGTYSKKLGGVIGSAAIENISKYRVDKAFIGSCGVNLLDNTVSNFDMEEGNTKKAIMNSGKNIYLVMENEKFYFDGAYKFAHLKDIDAIVTEQTPNSKICEVLEKNRIDLI
ncbi:DeoR/GlpR family DNA-binding transcription regulator [Clostridium ganghwense]|uniref:DeoR/GlpR family DNA-binding transcription regulator n=1 Tax=Clostridium ganghwense TaxID=312089 RepID=A0ABT4CX99_9CLOT|nr:DeoR/GlpR family DNA-binding transcription regulator [Clostridium ganghwense]MCY6372806.1 DeoR/GlpR family DNA-binding transcription regulator [Clostridium ganghwense]